MVTVKTAAPGEAAAWCRMRLALWPEESAEDHRAAAERYFAGQRHEPKEVLLAFDDRGAPLGFAELSIRNIVDSCDTDRVAYLEGWYVVDAARRGGVGRALIEAAERWAKQQGCTEFGSDALLDNDVSLAAHLALGFEETSRVRNFRKSLS